MSEPCEVAGCVLGRHHESHHTTYQKPTKAELEQKASYEALKNELAAIRLFLLVPDNQGIVEFLRERKVQWLQGK